MYAVVSTGGKQYRLTKGAVVDVERVSGEVGDQVVFDQVLFLGGDDDQAVGGPTVKGARVLGTIVEQGKGDKVVVFKYKKRKMYRRRTGHRQLLTRVRVEEIQSGGSSAPPPAQKAEISSEDRQVIQHMQLLALMDLLKDMPLLEGETKAVPEEKK